MGDSFTDLNEDLKVCEDVFRVLSGQSGAFSSGATSREARDCRSFVAICTHPNIEETTHIKIRHTILIRSFAVLSVYRR